MCRCLSYKNTFILLLSIRNFGAMSFCNFVPVQPSLEVIREVEHSPPLLTELSFCAGNIPGIIGDHHSSQLGSWGLYFINPEAELERPVQLTCPVKWAGDFQISDLGLGSWIPNYLGGRGKKWRVWNQSRLHRKTMTEREEEKERGEVGEVRMGREGNTMRKFYLKLAFHKTLYFFK